MSDKVGYKICNVYLVGEGLAILGFPLSFNISPLCVKQGLSIVHVDDLKLILYTKF